MYHGKYWTSRNLRTFARKKASVLGRIFARRVNRDCIGYILSYKLRIFVLRGPLCGSTCTVFNAECNSVSGIFSMGNRGARIPRNVTRFLRRGLFRDRSNSTFAHCTRANTCTGTFASFSGAYCVFGYASHFSRGLSVLLSFIRDPCFAGTAIRGRRKVVNRRVEVCSSDPT